MAPETSGFVSELISTAGGVVASIAGVAWYATKVTLNRIRKLEECTVRKSEFEELEKNAVTQTMFNSFAQRAEIDRQELRSGIVKLFDKVDELKNLIIDRRESK